MTFLSKIVIGLYVLFLVLWAFLWKGHLPYYIDARLYAYPDHWVNLEAFHRGLLPLWNPYIACGTPHLANWQSACFYPPFWFFNLTGLSGWFMWMALAHTGLAFAGAFLWLRRQETPPLWCALGALSFSGSAHLTRCWANLPFIASAAWIPWVFWAAHRSLQKPDFKNWSLLGFFLSLQILAGYPFFTFYTVLFLLAWFWFQRPPAQTLKWMGFTLGAAALLTCPQWLPFLELLTYAKPGNWGQYPYFDRPLDYLSLLKPGILGILGSNSYRGPFANGTFNLYFGLIPLGVLGLNLFSLPRRKNRFWTLSSFLWLLWLAGPHFPPWGLLPLRWLEWVEPSKAVGLFLFCAVTAVSISLGRWFGKNPPMKLKIAAAGLIALFWMADLARLPSLLLQPMPDPYENAGVQENARKTALLLGGGRLLSLHTANELSFTGTAAEAYQHTFELPVKTFLANSNAVWDIRSADRYLFLQVEGSENLVRYYNKCFPYDGDLLDVAGVRLLLLPTALSAPKYQTLGNLGNDFFILNRKASPDLRWVGDEVEFPDRAGILGVLARPDSRWEQKVYLEKNQDGSRVTLAPVSRFISTNSAVPRRAGAADFRLPKGGLKGQGSFVAFNETFAPGWHAWVDGKPTPILRAYGLFMAVPLGEGDNHVEFRYEPASFRLGLFLSLITIAWLVGMLIRSYFVVAG